MPPPLRCVPLAGAEIAIAASPSPSPSTAAALSLPLQLASPTADLSAHMQTAAIGFGIDAHAHSSSNKENSYSGVFSFRVNGSKGAHGDDQAAAAKGTDAAAGIDAARSQPPVDHHATHAIAIATANNANHTNATIAPRAPLQPLDPRAAAHWRSDSASASPPSSGSGLGLTFGLGSGGTLLTNNSNLSNSFRKGNGKRCLTRTPLQDAAGNTVADYPHAAETTALPAPITVGMRLNMDTGTLTHNQLTAAEPSMQQKVDGSLSARADQGASLQLHSLPSAALFSAPVAPLLPPASSFSPISSSLSSPCNGGSASLRGPRFHDSPEEVDGMNVDHHDRTHDLAPLESLPRTPTPCSSPARQQLQFDSGDKSAPSSSSSSSSVGFRGVGMAASSSSSSVLNGSGVRASSGFRAPLSPLPLLDSPVVVRKSNRNSGGGAGQGSHHLGFSGLRGATPNGGLSARQQAMLASPALTIEVSSEPSRSRFQIRSLAGLVEPAPAGARGARGASAAAAGPAMSTHEQESRREEEEMAQNRLSAAAAAAAVAAAVAATTDGMGVDAGAASSAAQVERHRPKRARSIAASLFSSVAVELPPSRSGSMSACGPSASSSGFAEGSSSTGVSPLLQSSSLVSLQAHPSRCGGASSASLFGLQSHSYSASSHSSLTLALSQSGRRSTPLLSRTLSSPLLCAHSEADSGSASEASTPHSESAASAGVSGALSPADQMMNHNGGASYDHQLLLSSALAAEDSLLRTMAETSSGLHGHNSSAPSSSMLPRSSASASPRCGGGASASPTPSPLDEEAFAGSWGLTPMAAAMSSPLGETEGVSLMEFIPTLRIDETSVAGPAAVSSAPLRMEESSCAAADLALGRRPHHPLRRHHAHAASVVPCTSAMSLHRRGSTSMIDSALINAHAPLVGLSAQAQVQAAAAATAAVLMDESEDDAAECASALPAMLSSSGCASVSTGAAGSSGVLPGISGGPCDVKRISAATMVRLLAGDFQNELDNFIVIDCRYDYEYTGGHIDGAINLNDRALLSKFFRVNSSLGSRLAVVFHCEFSQNRAPKSYRFFRELDRIRNASAYPLLSYPEIAVLDGGYKAFYHAHPERCTPSAYVSMWDEAFQRECKEQTSIHRKSWGTGKVAAAHAHGHGHGHGRGGGGADANASRALRRRSNTHGGLGLPMTLLRAVSAVEPGAAATAAAASPCGSTGASGHVHGRGSSMFSPALSGRSSSAACAGSPLPSFSLLSAAASPADATVHGAVSAAAGGAAPSACSSSASTPAAAHGPSAHERSVGAVSPLAFDINISSPERNDHGQGQEQALGLGHTQSHRSSSM